MCSPRCKSTITGIVAIQNDRFELQYDRALAASGMNPGLNGTILREAYTMAVSAFGLLILAAAVLFYIPLVAKMGVPRLIIGLFFILLCLLAMILGLSLPSQLSNTLVRLGMNGVLVLAMLPGIQCGISLNLGLPHRHYRRPHRRPAVHRVRHVRLHGAVLLRLRSAL